MPVYNGARFLREAMDSILIQTYTNFELIVIDDAGHGGGSLLTAVLDAVSRVGPSEFSTLRADQLLE